MAMVSTWRQPVPVVGVPMKLGPLRESGPPVIVKIGGTAHLPGTPLAQRAPDGRASTYRDLVLES